MKSLIKDMAAKNIRMAIINAVNFLVNMTANSGNAKAESTEFKIRKHSGDKLAVNEIWKGKIYTPPNFEIKENDIVVDVGAHIGIFSAFAAALAKNGTVYSYEPVPENFNLLQENIRNNGLKNIKLFEMAVSKDSGKIKMSLSSLSNSCHSASNGLGIGNNSRTISANAITLEEIFLRNNLENVNFLKMDCEGLEYEILTNTPKKQLKKIEKISMEFHEFGKYKASQMKNFLENNGFKISIKRNMINHLIWKTGMIYASRA